MQHHPSLLPCRSSSTRQKAFWLMLLWGVAQSTSLRALLTTNNEPTSSSSSTNDRSDLQKLYSGIKFTRSTAQSSFTSSSSSSTSDNSIPNYAAMPEYQVFFGSDEVPSTKSSGISPRIVGGSVATPNRFFTMQLTKNATTGSWHFAGCSGTLISACHILTAAHCVAGNRRSLVQGLYVGAYTPFNGNSGNPYQFSAPQSITAHPGFNPTTDVNDVAVIRLQQCVDTNKFPPATVATPTMMSNLVNGQSVTAMGFGRLSMTSNVQTQTLLSVNLNYYGTSYCNSLYQPYGSTIYSDMFCAGVNGGGKDACQGDSGGPLVLASTSTLIGVVSWGRGCAVANFPGVYNSVASHYTWIQNQVCADASVSSSLPLCLTFSNRVQASIPAPSKPTVPAPVVRVPIRPSPRPTLRPTTKASFCNTNINGAFSYTTSTGVVITMACSRMQVGQLGHKVCTQKGAMKTCPKACHPMCQS